MKPNKIVRMVCPNCGESYPEKEQHPKLNPQTGKIDVEMVPRKKCVCGMGLVRRVVKFDKREKAR